MDNELTKLQRMSRAKQVSKPVIGKLGTEIVSLFKQQIDRNQKKFGKISDAWLSLVPEVFHEYTELNAFTRGTLTVLVDNSSQLYNLKQALLAGLQDQLILASMGSGLRKIVLKPSGKKSR